MNHFDYELQREREREQHMMDYLKSAGLTLFGMVLTAEGFRVMLTVGTGVVGFLTACCGLTAGIMGVLYGWRKLNKQQEEKDNE